MALGSRIKGVLNKAIRNSYRSIARATGLISKRTYDIVTSAGRLKKPFEDIVKSIRPVDQRLYEITVPSHIRTFSSQIRIDPRTHTWRSVKTGRLLGRADKDRLLNSHRRNVLLRTIKNRNRQLSDKQIIKKALEIEDRLRRIQDLRKLDDKDPRLREEGFELQKLKEEIGLFTP